MYVDLKRESKFLIDKFLLKTGKWHGQCVFLNCKIQVMTRLLLVLLVMSIFFGCAEKKKADNGKSDIVEIEMVVKDGDEQNDIPFPIYDFDGFEPLLHNNDGKTYVINFWATWCKPCIEEMPHFERINSEYGEKNVEVVLVSLDMPNMWKSRLEPYVEKNKIQSQVVILDDPKQNDWIPKVSEEWGGGIPATLIYNKEKRTFYERGFTYEELNNELKTFIN